MTLSRDLDTAFQALKDDDLDTAATTIAEILAEHPDSAKAYNLSAKIALKSGNLAKAETDLKTALEKNPDDAESLNSYGNLLVNSGRVSAAKTAFRRAIDAVPNYFDPIINLGQLYLSEHDPLRALDVFREGLKYFENHPALLMGMMSAFKDSQQYDKALDLLEGLHNIPASALSAGQVFAALGQNFQARQAFVFALSHQPTTIPAFRHLVQLEWLDKGEEAGRKLIAQMMEKSPEAAALWIHGADVLRELGALKDASDLLSEAEKKFGSHPDIDTVRAGIAMAKNEPEAAFDLAEKAIKARPGDPSILAHLTDSALATHNSDLALEASNAVLRTRPNDQAWIGRKSLALRLGRTEEAELNNFERWIKTYSLDTPPEYDTRADFFDKLDKALVERIKSGIHPIGQSLRRGRQTPDDLRFAPDRVIQDLFQELSNPIHDYLAHIGQAQGHPTSRRNSGHYRITSAWSVMMEAGGFHRPHVHSDSWISGILYVRIPKDASADKTRQGWLQFGKPPFDVAGLEAEHWITPGVGKLVLFPSYIWHGTQPVAQAESRLTLSFNMVPA